VSAGAASQANVDVLKRESRYQSGFRGSFIAGSGNIT
jgi:hypothetical protein